MTRISTPTPNKSRLPRRMVLATGAAAFSASFLPKPAQAITQAQATGLVESAVAEINQVINSGRPEAAMLRDFERIFARYADVPTIAQSVLGPPARSASRAELRAFTEAFQGYISRKYGRRFREFIGGSITVTGGRPVRSFYEVISVAQLRGQAPFDVRWLVSDQSGSNRFFNLIIEGVNLMISERNEIGALLDRNGGDIGRLTQALRNA